MSPSLCMRSLIHISVRNREIEKKSGRLGERDEGTLGNRWMWKKNSEDKRKWRNRMLGEKKILNPKDLIICNKKQGANVNSNVFYKLTNTQFKQSNSWGITILN